LPTQVGQPTLKKGKGFLWLPTSSRSALLKGQQRRKIRRVAQISAMKFVQFFLSKTLDKLRRPWYNCPPAHIRAGRYFVKMADCTKISTKSCAFCQLYFIPKSVIINNVKRECDGRLRETFLKEIKVI